MSSFFDYLWVFGLGVGVSMVTLGGGSYLLGYRWLKPINTRMRNVGGNIWASEDGMIRMNLAEDADNN